MNLEERYFRLLGWVKEVDEALNLEVYRERYNGEVLSHPYLPNILDSQAEFIKWVVVPMRERGWRVTLEEYGNGNGGAYWKRTWWRDPQEQSRVVAKHWTPENDNIFAAAILAACEVLEDGEAVIYDEGEWFQIIDPEGRSYACFPNILDSQAEFIKRVVVPMRERGYNPQIIYCGPDNDHFVWKVQPFGHQVIVKIKDNNIFEAAILGACEVLEGGKETG